MGNNKIFTLFRKEKTFKPISVQNGYNLINRTYDISNSEISIREGIGLIAHSSLAGGLLSGKYLFDKKPKIQIHF